MARSGSATGGAKGLGLLVLLTLVMAWSAARSDDPLTRVKIEHRDAHAVAQRLIDAGFAVVEGSVAEGSLEVEANQVELAALGRMGFRPVVVAVGRPLREIEAERAAAAAPGAAPPGYPDLTEILVEMNAAAAAHPAICQMVDLTSTYGVPATFEGRQIFAVKISDQVAQDEDEPAFLLVAAHHGKETGGSVVALHAIEQLTTLYGSDPAITSLVDEYEIWIAPVWNPDGYEYAFEFDNTWRKNRRVFAEGIGVELNRNYPFGWSSPCAGPTHPSSGSYKGPSPASESETQTMVALTDDRRFAKVLDFHQSGSEILLGYHCLYHPFRPFLLEQAIELSNAFGFGGDNRPPSAEGEHYEWQLAMRGAQANLVEMRNGPLVTYEVIQQEAIDLFPGVLFSLQRPILLGGHVTDALTGDPVVATLRYLEIEYENGETNASGARFGRYHAFPPPGELTVEFSAPGYETQYHGVTIDPQVAQTLDVQLQPSVLLLVLIEGPSGLIELGTAPEVVVEITSGTENLVPGSATLYHRDDDGGFLSIPLVPSGGDRYSATLPTVDRCGRHEYYVGAQGDGGTPVTLPSSAPAFVFDFDVGESQVAVAFDDTWRYFKGVAEPSPGDLTAWTRTVFDESSWEEGGGSFGYGTDCSPFGTVLDDMPGGYRSLYLRKSFHLADPAIVLEMTLTADYDDGFVAYINGVEVARNNVQGDPPPFDGLATSDHECSGSPLEANPPEEHAIHESFDLATLLLAGENVLAIQGHNLTDTSSDFTLEMGLTTVVCGCNDDADCDDGDACNGVESCSDDLCLPGTPIDCAPLICNPADGSCVACLGDADCDDGDLCNGDETCDGGACVAGSGLDCDDGIACTDDACDPGSGCSNLDNCPVGQLCNPSSGSCEVPTVEPLPIVEGAEWRFFKGTEEPNPGDLTAWTRLTFDDASWETGSSGFGYGVDCPAGTALGDMQNGYSSLYARRLFLVSQPSLVDELILTLDYDDSFVAYLNGIEVARNNVLGNPPAFNALAQVDHECSGSSGAANPPESFDLHLGFDLGALLQPGANVLAIQGHNLTLGSSDFTLIPTLEAVEVEGCTDPAECDDDDPCTEDDCVGGACSNPPVSCPSGESCNPANGQCELMVTLSFQEGAGGYAETVDTFVQEDPSAADNDNGALEALNWDGDDPSGSGLSTATLVRFDDIFGDGNGRIPVGAQINWATLSYTVGGDVNAPGDDGELHAMLVPWAESVSWNGLGTTPGLTAGEDYATEVVTVLPGSPAATLEVDVTTSLQDWSGEPSSNFGWAVLPTGTDGVDVRSSEFVAGPAVRPELTVNFTLSTECSDASDCDDGDVCNGSESCDGSGTCQPGTPLDCDDGNPCTVDGCDPGQGCQNPNASVGTPCDDTDLCNGSESCDGSGTCQPGTPLDCDDGNPCTVDGCDPGQGCQNPNASVGTPCDDTDLCNGSESCDGSGTCQPGTPLDCDDGNVCTSDGCDSVQGCVYTPSGVCGISGSVIYYRDHTTGGFEPSAKTVPAVDIDTSQDGAPDATTDGGGSYAVGNLAGTVRIETLEKYGFSEVSDHHGAITGFDATFIGQHAVQQIVLSEMQQVAGDVSGNGEVTSYDAAKVGQFAVGLIPHFEVGEATGSDWAFYRCDHYVDATSQDCAAPVFLHDPIVGPGVDDFYAALYGEVTGNWAPARGAASASNEESLAARRDRRQARALSTRALDPDALSALRQPAAASVRDTASLVLMGWGAPASRAVARRELVLEVRKGDGIQAFDLQLRLDPSRVTVVDVQPGDLTSGFNLATHDLGSDYRIGLYGLLPLEGSGSVAVITVEVAPGVGGGELPFTIRGQANERPIPVRVGGI